MYFEVNNLIIKNKSQTQKDASSILEQVTPTPRDNRQPSRQLRRCLEETQKIRQERRERAR